MTKKKKIILVALIALVMVIVAIILVASLNKPTYYTVEFDSVGGSEVDTQTIEEGLTAVKPNDPEKEGFIFVEWLYNNDTFDFSSPINENIKLVAKWHAIREDVESFVIKFDSDGGTTIPNQILEKGELVTKPEDPEKDGYKFIEWTLEDVVYDFNSEVTDDITLVAKYEKVEEEKKETNQSSSNSSNKDKDSNKNTEDAKSTTPKTPVLSIPGLTASDMPGYGEFADNGMYTYDFAINSSSYLKDNKYIVNGYDLFEKNGTKYTLVKSASMGGAAVVQVEAGTKKTYVAKVYVLNSKKEKVYSPYSNEVVIDKTTYKAPVLSVPGLTASDMPGYGEFADNGMYTYDFAINSSSYLKDNKYIVDGYDLFEKNGTKYTLVKSASMDGAAVVQVEAGTKKTFVARVYVLNSKKEKVYSAYSNEIVIDKTTYKAPVLSIPNLNEPGYGEELVDGVYIYDFAINTSDYMIGDIFNVDGFDLFEKNNANYTLVSEAVIGGAAVAEIESGTKKTYVARVYVLNSKGQKIYSPYSNEITIDKTN